jgi:creatinine amidohydrolase
VPSDAYRALVGSYLEGLERTGIGKIAVVSTHGGNFEFAAKLAADWPGEARIACYSDLGRFLDICRHASAQAGLPLPLTDAHAGGMETSMMLASFPEFVRPFHGVSGYTAAEPGWRERVFAGIHNLSLTGVLGDVRGSNASAGEAVFAALSEELADFFARELDVGLAEQPGH